MFTLLAFFFGAIVFGSLMEYLLHRFVLHSRMRNYVIRRHRMHHKTYTSYSLVNEFVTFFLPGIPFLWVGFLHSTGAGFAFIAGEAAYALVIATAHKWSHEAPYRVFWTNPAAHAVHHDESPRWNYGIATNFWDRVFGTYRAPVPRAAEST